MSRRFALVAAAAATAACSRPVPGSPAESAHRDGAALVGTTIAADGITTIAFPADAFERAVQFTADSVPIATIGGSDAPPEFDLTYAMSAVILPSGGYASLMPIGGGHLMFFDSAGRPVHSFGRLGQGPGEFNRPGGPLLLGGDTLLVPDAANRRLNYFLPGKGLLATTAMAAPPATLHYGLETPVGRIGDRLVWTNSYWIQRDTLHISRPPVPLAVSTMTFDSLRIVDSIAGTEMAPVMTHYRGRARTKTDALRLGQRALFAVWDTLLVEANGAHGYLLDVKNPAGHLVRRITVAVPRRMVTKAMRDAQIAAELARFSPSGYGEGMADSGESRRLIYATPFADSLPPYQRLLVAPDSILWVVDAVAPSDSAWDATGFRSDGAIVGRLHVAHRGIPVAIGRDRVVMRTVNGDGVASFVVYRIGRP